MQADNPLGLIDQRAEQLRRSLHRVRGLKLIDSYRGVVSAGRVRAEMELEPGDWIRVALACRRQGRPSAALQANSRLAGNVRFAGGADDFAVLADTQVNGAAHLEASFREIRTGLRQAAAGGSRDLRRRPPEADAAAVDSAVHKLGWDDQSVVRRPDGWELRPRFRDVVCPVQLELCNGGLRLHAVVLDHLPEGTAREAVADHALRLNRQIRLARLCERADQLWVEAWLHAGQIDPSWLAVASQSIATALWRARPALEILADLQPVALAYARVFLSPSSNP